VLQIFAQPVTQSKLGLDRDEVGTRVAQEGKEEQSGVHAAQAITAVHEVVTPAEHFGAAIAARAHEAYVRIGCHQWPLIAALEIEVWLAELAAA
jgi:hypothetical protein